MSHLEQSLQRDIDRITATIHRMAGLAEHSLEQAIQALGERNRKLAYSVILRDQRIDELEKELDRLCLEFLVRQQPVARHLRFAYAAIKINSHLERVGDYAESIARQVVVLCSLEVEIPYQRFADMARQAIPMLGAAARAFIEQDAGLARETMLREDTVDRLRHQLSSDLVRMQVEGRLLVEALPPLQNIANRLERVADQAKSICQDVLYLCTGEYLKHPGSEVYRVLFVDRNNSCLSQMAEALGHSLGQPKFVFSSAGLEPQVVDPRAIAFLRQRGLDISAQRSKSVEQILHLDHYQLLVALAPEAVRVFPPPPTKAVCLVWDVPDPSLSSGSADEAEAAYQKSYQFLQDNIQDLVQAILGDDADNK